MATVCVCREGKLRGSREFRFYSRSSHGSGFQDELSPPSLLYNTKRSHAKSDNDRQSVLQTRRKCFERRALVLFSSLLSTGRLSRFQAGDKPYPSWGSPSGTDVISNKQIESSYLMASGTRSSRGGRVSAPKRLRIINSGTVFSNC